MAQAGVEDNSKPKANPSSINWSEIDTILLDMDGTLLDLNFDLHFWMDTTSPIKNQKTSSTP